LSNSNETINSSGPSNSRTTSNSREETIRVGTQVYFVFLYFEQQYRDNKQQWPQQQYDNKQKQGRDNKRRDASNSKDTSRKFPPKLFRYGGKFVKIPHKVLARPKYRKYDFANPRMEDRHLTRLFWSSLLLSNRIDGMILENWSSGTWVLSTLPGRGVGGGGVGGFWGEGERVTPGRDFLYWLTCTCMDFLMDPLDSLGTLCIT
jgi:hypothetical protein